MRTLILILLVLLAGCSVEKRAQKKVAWLLAKDVMDDACARLYPVRDSVVVRDSLHFDTLYVENETYIRDTVVREGQTVYIEKKCPPHQVITKTVTRDSFIYRTNTADVERLKGEVLAVQKQLVEKDGIIINQQKNLDKDNWWKVACIVTWCGVLLGFVFRFFVVKKPI